MCSVKMVVEGIVHYIMPCPLCKYPCEKYFPKFSSRENAVTPSFLLFDNENYITSCISLFALTASEFVA